MRTPSLRLACLLGLASGAAEVVVRAEPRLGLPVPAVMAWLGAAYALSVAFLLAWALALRALVRLAGPRVPATGWLVASLACVHAGLAWRFDLHVNAFASDPVVWGGLAGIVVLSGAAGALLDRPLRAAGRGLDAAAILIAVAGTGTALLRSQPAQASPRPDPARPDILLVSLDTVRADALSPWDATRRTPAVARLAAEGAVFDQAVATAPLTEPSHLAMLSGLAPHRTGLVANGTDVPPGVRLVPEVLGANGWSTAAFVSGFPLHGRYGWTRGFDVYDDDFGVYPGLHRLSLVKAWDQVALPAHALRERRGDRAVDRALAWLDRQDGPWFVLLHLFDPHGPYEPPPPFAPARAPTAGGPPLALPASWPARTRAVTDVAWLTEAYHGEVRFADAQVGRVLDRLAARGRLDRTIVVLVGDHGESLGEHGYLFDHGDDLFDPSLRVPLVVRAPSRVPAGVRVACQVPTSDLAPTLLDLAGLPGADLPGVSLLDMVRVPCADRDVVATTVGARFVPDPPMDHALRCRGLKWIRPQARPPSLYDLAADSGETHDIASERPADAAALDAVLADRLAGGAPPEPRDAGADTLRGLRALGYLD
jgi:arylsulfatase A-like enzyme